tara:strand:+ start:2925 stop:3584 length:660 start_codon:yes stop_codon:yes gene_type:complete
MSVLPKIDEEIMAANKSPEPIEEESIVITEKNEEVIEEAEEPLENKEIFEKPKIEISKKTGKPKRKMSQAQIDGLKKAREKSAARRKALKEGKDIEKETKRLQREQKREEREDKSARAQELITLKAKLAQEAQQANTWDEARLTGLMEKTIENFIQKKKAEKPKPQVTIPPVNHNPQVAPQYYQTATNYNPRQRTTYPSRPAAQAGALDTLFGVYTTNN